MNTACLLLVMSVLSASAPPDGTAIFIRTNGKQNIVTKEITATTGDTLTHTAIVLYERGTPYVYESTLPRGVQRSTLDQFY